MLKRKKAMESLTDAKTCPQCGAGVMKSWTELSDEQKFLVERLPLSADFTPEERKKHRFCTRCWHEETAENNTC